MQSRYGCLPGANRRNFPIMWRASLVLAPIWVWLGVGEVPSTLTLAGGAVVFLAITGHGVLALRRSRRVATAN